MDEGPDRGDGRPAPFPGAAFWQGLESALTAVGLGSPRMLFRLRNARARWEQRRATAANLERGAAYSHKACPGCARLVPRGSGRCPYCQANVRWAPGPGLARTLGLGIPHGSVAMTIVTANIAFFAITTLASARSSGTSPLAALFAPTGEVLYNMGALEARSIFFGQIWRLWTYEFLHIGALHIFFNVYALLSLGPATEDVYGPSKTASLYWLTGVAAGLASLAAKVASPLARGIPMNAIPVGALGITAGASGSIFGLIGLLIGHTLRRGGSQSAALRAFLVRWAIYGLVMGFMLHADNSAHVGGLAAGFLAGLLVPENEPARGAGSVFWRLAAFAVTGLTIFGFAAAALAPHA